MAVASKRDMEYPDDPFEDLPPGVFGVLLGLETETAGIRGSGLMVSTAVDTCAYQMPRRRVLESRRRISYHDLIGRPEAIREQMIYETERQLIEEISRNVARAANIDKQQGPDYIDIVARLDLDDL